MRFPVVVVVAAGVLGGCVEQEAYLTRTPSGRPEAEFVTRNPAVVSERLTTLCASRGYLVQQSSPSQVVCGGQMQGGDALLAQLAIGNSYSTTPEQYVRFAILPYGGKVRVQAYQWVETQMAFGQVNKVELNSGNQFNSIMRALASIGGTPVGVAPSR